MYLDLRSSVKLETQLNLKFNNLSKKNIIYFNQLIEKSYNQVGSNLDWFCSSAASRNPINSNLFNNFCKFLLVQELIDDGKKINELVCDSFGLNQMIQINFKNNIDKITFIKLTKKQKFKKILYKLYEISLKIYQLIICRYTIFIYKQKKLSKKFILIDTFVFENFVDKDRYFKGLVDNVELESLNNIFFVPTITDLNFKNILKIYKEIRLSKRKLVVKEDYLTLTDLLYAFLFIFRIKKINLKKIIVKKIDFSDLLNDDLKTSNYSLSQPIESILNFCFIKRLSNKKYKIDLFINWWENQSLDKAYNFALNFFFNKTPSIGYIGYAPRNFDFQLFPTEFEKAHMIIPNKIAVIGNGYLDTIKKFNNNQNVVVAPSFRFNHIFSFIKKNNSIKGKKILIGLPILISKANFLLDSLPENIQTISNNYNIEILIKPHPATIKQFKLSQKNLSKIENCKIVTDDTSSILKDVDVLISSMSSICMESIAMNIPCIVFDESVGLEYIPIPENIDQDIWKLCKNSNQIFEALLIFLHRDEKTIKRHLLISSFIRENYFLKTNTKNISKFLDLKSTC